MKYNPGLKESANHFLIASVEVTWYRTRVIQRSRGLIYYCKQHVTSKGIPEFAYVITIEKLRSYIYW